VRTPWLEPFSCETRRTVKRSKTPQAKQGKFQTNLGYQPLKVLVKKVNAGYQVDEATRYLTEDVPFSLLVTKGIALVVGVETRWGTCWV